MGFNVRYDEDREYEYAFEGVKATRRLPDFDKAIATC